MIECVPEEKLRVFKNNSVSAGQMKKITPPNVAKEARCAAGMPAVCVHSSRFHMYEKVEEPSEEGRALRFCKKKIK